MTLALRTSDTLVNTRQAMELVCYKIGLVLLVLGGMHFFNLYVFNRLRKRGSEQSGRAFHAPGKPAGWGPQGAPIGKVLE